METIQFWANMAAIVGVPIAIIGLIITFLSLRARIKDCEGKIATFNEIINLQSARYENCTFNYTREVASPSQVKGLYG